MFGYAAGAAIALAARRPLARTYDPVHTRYFAAAALWSGAVFAPTGVVLYAEYPDWMLMYLANPAHLAAAVMFPLLFAIYFGAPLVGFLVTQRQLVAGRPGSLRASIGAALFLLAVVVIFGRTRLLSVAYYDAFHAGVDTVSVFRSPLLLALFPCSVAICGILAFVLASVKKHADLVEHVPGERRASASPHPLAGRFGLDGNTAEHPGSGAGGPANLPRPPEGATPRT